MVNFIQKRSLFQRSLIFVVLAMSVIMIGVCYKQYNKKEKTQLISAPVPNKNKNKVVGYVEDIHKKLLLIKQPDGTIKFV